MRAKSADSFLRAQGGRVDWRMMAALKTGVDQLVHRDLKAADRLVGRIEQLVAPGSEPVLQAFAQASRARLLHLSGHHAEADALFEAAIGAMQDAKIAGEAAKVQRQRIDTLTQLGRYDEALQTARRARPVLIKSGRSQLAQLENNVGNVYYRLDRYAKALDHYDKARAMLSGKAGRSMRAVIDGNRSNIYVEIDQPDRALRLLEQCAAAWERSGQSLSAAQARSKVAYLDFLRGNYNTALTAYYQMRTRLQALRAPRLVAWCDLEIAEVLLALNAFGDAVESAASAERKFRELGMPYESAQAGLTQAIAAMGLGRFQESETTLMSVRAAVEAFGNQTFVATIDSYLANLSVRLNDPATALQRAESAARFFQKQKLPMRTAYARLFAARAAYQMKDLARADRMVRGSLRTISAFLAPALAYQCHHLVGLIERDRGRKRAALNAFRKAVATVEQMRGGIAGDELKTTFLRDKTEVYEDAITACIEQPAGARLEEAFKLVESSKSRALADLLARYIRGSTNRPKGEKRQKPNAGMRVRLLKLIEDLNWYTSRANLEDDKGDQRRANMAGRYRQQVKKYERLVIQVFRRIEAQDSAFAEMHRMRAATVSELRQILAPCETAIEYFITGDRISAFVASNRRITLVRDIASKNEIEGVLSALRFQIEKFNLGRDYTDAHSAQLKYAADEYLAILYNSLLEPLMGFVENERLVVIPHAALHYVPFHALRDHAGYLVDRFEISYAPSAGVLKLCRERSGQLPSGGRGRLVAFGVPQADTPSIADEIGCLSASFPNARTFVGSEATRENLLRFAPEARFLHLASHAYFRRDNPMFSFLKLADSQLNFYSLLDLKLKARLVTLSACHTGVNMVFPGDELHGLMRGFLYAGAPSLIASLWAVSDRSTAELMTDLYSRIASGESISRALRLAQLRSKETYGHPYHWAPFVLVGS